MGETPCYRIGQLTQRGADSEPHRGHMARVCMNYALNTQYLAQERLEGLEAETPHTVLPHTLMSRCLSTFLQVKRT